MLLTPHILAGMAFGELSSSGAMSIFAGIASYFILELIPHWDPEDGQRKFTRFLRFFDLIIGFLSYAIICAVNQFDIGLALGGAMSALMFVLFFAASTSTEETGFLKKLNNFKKVLNYTDKSFWGILIQISVCILCVTIIFQLVDFPTWDKIFAQVLELK